MEKSVVIHYLKGDATSPQAKGPKILAHICNDAGKWGKGFVLAVSNKWPDMRESFLNYYKAGHLSKLGDVQFSDTTDLGQTKNIIIANMIAQHGIKTSSNISPIRYDALRTCLLKVAAEAKYHSKHHSASVHMPRIGCGLAGGTWDKVEPVITETMAGIDVYVYDFEPEP